MNWQDGQSTKPARISSPKRLDELRDLNLGVVVVQVQVGKRIESCQLEC